ncbi:Lpg1974 family pore-forming outer membrane protein [Candidatus Neptunichlamydia sp. REUL1]|uniref:Lpg1974 family pore-forming outer membrane protein n=1 Tax=Candidatus Neptunichlamydia sp. REUL1 TaxID=3064277 RepID=UPI00292F306B|nr:Lpg1974 family pore-forming outer membrane protein [Candidatus Neptunochlamydia sp. REUL1]
MKWMTISIFCTLSLFAEKMERRVDVLEHQMGEVGTKTPSGEYGAQLANATFERGWVGVELFGSPLYWHAKVGGTEYVYSLVSGKGKVESQSFDWDFGYRLGAGVFLPIVKWEVLGTYTHFGTQDTEGRGVIPPSLLVNLRGSFFVFSQSVKSSYDIDYDTVSFELKRSSFLGSLLGLGSSLGVKQGWIDQKQSVTYSAFQEELTKVKDRCRFRGVGPLLGMNINWHLFSGFSFLGDIKGALLYGDFEVKHTEPPIEVKGAAHLFSPNLSFTFGLNKDFPIGGAQVFISLAYEADYYWRQNQMVTMEDADRGRLKIARQAEDLTFYGVTGRLGIEF